MLKNLLYSIAILCGITQFGYAQSTTIVCAGETSTFVSDSIKSIVIGDTYIGLRKMTGEQVGCSGDDFQSIHFSNELITNQLQIETEDNVFNLFPNPVVDNKITLVAPVALTGQVLVSIVDIDGNTCVKQSLIFGTNASQIDMDVSQLSGGIYQVVITGNDFSTSKRFIK